MAKRKKIHDPAQATIAALERREREAEVSRLQSQGATVTTDRTGRVISARRSNVFTLLLARNTITQSHHDAAYRLAQTWMIWKGLEGRGELPVEFVNGKGELEPVETSFVAAKRQAVAGQKIVAILDQLARADARLLCAFMVATVEEDRCMAWRGIVERELAITVRDRQTAAVVDALEALRSIYEQPRRAAA